MIDCGGQPGTAGEATTLIGCKPRDGCTRQETVEPKKFCLRRAQSGAVSDQPGPEGRGFGECDLGWGGLRLGWWFIRWLNGFLASGTVSGFALDSVVASCAVPG